MKFAYLRSQRKVIFHQKSSFPFSWFLRIERICRFARKTYFLVLRKIFSSPSPSSPNIAPRGLRKKKAGKNVLLFAMNAPILAGLFAFYAVTEFLTVVKAEREKVECAQGNRAQVKNFFLSFVSIFWAMFTCSILPRSFVLLGNDKRDVPGIHD